MANQINTNLSGGGFNFDNLNYGHSNEFNSSVSSSSGMNITETDYTLPTTHEIDTGLLSSSNNSEVNGSVDSALNDAHIFDNPEATGQTGATSAAAPSQPASQNNNQNQKPQENTNSNENEGNNSSSGEENSRNNNQASNSNNGSSSGNMRLNGNVIDTSEPCYYGKKYELSEYEIRRLAYLAYKEQGTLDGAKVELSQMANLTEHYGKSDVYSHVFSGSRSFYGPVKRGEIPQNPKVPQEYIDATREVLVNGNRYLPQNVYEHDCIYDYSTKSGRRQRDVTKIVTNGRTYTGESIENRNNYIPGETKIYASSGSVYVFDGFAPNGGDPFGHVVSR